MHRTRATSAGRSESRIGLPLLGSAAGHAVLLWALLLPGAAPGPRGEGVIQVLLVEGPASAYSGAGAPAPRPASGPRSVSRAEVSPPLPKPAVAPLPPPRAAPVSPAFPEEAERTTDRDPLGAAGVPAGREEAGPAVLPGARPGPSHAVPMEGVGVPDAHSPGSGGRARPGGSELAGGGGDTRILVLLRTRIRERIVYPAEAVRRGQEGEVLLRIRIGFGGVPREIRIAKSSGVRILDEAARRGVVRAAPLPSVPGWFEIPVRFSLR